MRRILLIMFAAVVLGAGTLLWMRGTDEPRTLVVNAKGEYVIDDCLPYGPRIVEP